MPKVTNSDIAAAAVATGVVAAGALTTRFVWRRVKNRRKAKK